MNTIAELEKPAECLARDRVLLALNRKHDAI
jgi:hypothetical protein